jgi:hypothetical protein
LEAVKLDLNDPPVLLAVVAAVLLLTWLVLRILGIWQ